MNSFDIVECDSVLYRLLISPIQKSIKQDVTELCIFFTFGSSILVKGQPERVIRLFTGEHNVHEHKWFKRVRELSKCRLLATIAYETLDQIFNVKQKRNLSTFPEVLEALQ